jgi:hypothetical protein
MHEMYQGQANRKDALLLFLMNRELTKLPYMPQPLRKASLTSADEDDNDRQVLTADSAVRLRSRSVTESRKMLIQKDRDKRGCRW